MRKCRLRIVRSFASRRIWPSRCRFPFGNEATIDRQEIKEIIRKELAGILRDDPEMTEFVLRLSEGTYADRALTDSRFDRVLDELKSEREVQV